MYDALHIQTTAGEQADPVETSMNRLLEALVLAGIKFRENVDLSQFSYMKTGGTARLIIFPASLEEMAEVMRETAKADLPRKIIGNTSNILFLDEARYSLLISTQDMQKITFDEDTGIFCAEAGAMMPDLSREALYREMTGFEGLEGIPGTVGGGLFMNAGAYGYELKDVLRYADVVTPDGTIRRLNSSDFKLSHRSSILRKEGKGSVVCRLYFSGQKADPKAIFGKMEVFHAKRHKYQDFMYPNLGSIFSASPYRALTKKDPVFKILSAFYLLFRYDLKIFHRESPINRSWLNNIAIKRFPLRYPTQPFSDKTLNCLVNRGQGSTAMVQYIKDMDRLTDGKLPLENEILEEF